MSSIVASAGSVREVNAATLGNSGAGVNAVTIGVLDVLTEVLGTVAFTAFHVEKLAEFRDILLPIAGWTLCAA